MLILEPKPTKWIGTRSKLEIQNNSNYEIKYEASHYEEKQILRMEKEVNLNIPGVGGVGGSNKIDYSKAELFKTDKDTIPKNDAIEITVEGGKRVMIKYQYIGLHKDFTDAQRNVTVNHKVLFEQPSQETIDRIIRENGEKEKEEEIQRNKERECSSTYKKQCSASDTPKTQCHVKGCEDWYCNNHLEARTVFSVAGGIGGHVCSKLSQNPFN